MKKTVLVVCLAFSLPAWAVKLSDYKPFVFEALFTNPVCETYSYDRPVVTNSGKTVSAKPDDVYCKNSDEATSVGRRNAPQFRLKQWIEDPSTKELKLAYLSFSSKNIATSLCTAAKRGVKITMVLDGGEDGARPHTNKDAEALKKCGNVKTFYRGSIGGLGFAHNKVMLVNPGTKVVKIVFSSGNMSTGTSINHENWNFVTTAGNSFFAEAHHCLVNGMIEAGEQKAKFGQFLNDCRSKIKAQPEMDIQIYFSPTDGKAALNKVAEAGNRARIIEAMSHRFSGELSKLFVSLLLKGKDIRFILDDDVYWAEKLKKDVGRNTKIESFRLFNELINKGMKTKFLQTNQNIYQLQHNKFIVFNFGSTGAVFNGAGNFTTAAFTKNFENFYFITIPEVVTAYKKQYRLYFDQMATSVEDMPRDYVLP